MLPNCFLEVEVPKALLCRTNVPTPVDKRDADKSPERDGTRPRMLMPLKGEIAELLAKSTCIFEGMWIYELGSVDMKFELWQSFEQGPTV